MIIPEVKRVVRFDGFQGKTIKEIQEDRFKVRIIFTDGTFADLFAEATEDARVVLQGMRPRRQNTYR
jgi:hypothetical protein